MRSTKYSIVTAALGVANPAPLAPANIYRVALVFCPISDGNAFYVTPDPTAAALIGIRVSAETGPLTLRVEELGDILHNAWYGGSWGADQMVAVLDVSEHPGRRS